MKVVRFFYSQRGTYLTQIFVHNISNNSIIGIDTLLTSNINTRSQVGGLARMERKKYWTEIFLLKIFIFLKRQIRYPDTMAFWYPRNGKKFWGIKKIENLDLCPI